MGTVVQEKRSYKPFIHVVIMMSLMLFVRYIPPVGSITPLGMATLGIFVGIIYGWSTLGMIFPSFIGIMAFGFLEGNTVRAAVSTALGDRITIIIFLLFLVSALVEKAGLSDWIARWCITRKFAAGRPWVIAIMFCVAGSIISATVNLFAAIILMWNVFYSFCEQVGYKKGDRYPSLVLMAILYCCTMFGGVLPYMSISILVVGQLEKFTGLGINYFQFTVTMLVLSLIAAGIYFLILKYVFKPDVSCILNSNSDFFKQELPKLTGHQKLVCVLLITLMVFLFLPSLLPATIPGISFLKALDMSGVALVILSAYYILMLGRKDVIRFGELAKGISWDMIFMFATVAPLSVAINNPDSGILIFVKESMSSLLNGLSPILFTMVLFIIGSIITQFANNAVIVMIMSPIMFSLGDVVGANPYALTVLAAYCMNIAFVLPASSGPASMGFSNDWIGKKTSYTHGAIIFVLTLLVTFIGIPITNLVF